MFRKLILSLAAVGALGMGGVALNPAPAAATGIGFYFGTGGTPHYGGRHHYRPYRGGYRHRAYRPHRATRRVCEVRRVRTVRPNGRVVVRRVRDCYRAPAYRRW